MTHRLHVWIAGRVQGVGFRYATVREATARGLTGWVQNLDDGRVEAVFEGERVLLEDMADWCRGGPGFARVTDVEVQWESGEPRYDRFGIRGW
ncbi:MAG: acylphosphatase [Candidatus Hydrogenedentes bacterium]|nr:acylphosphatase [Candidatus Hydrogenedentota bacterium]